MLNTLKKETEMEPQDSKVSDGFLDKVRFLNSQHKSVMLSRKPSMSETQREEACDKMREVFDLFYELLLLAKSDTEYEVLAGVLNGIIPNNAKINIFVFKEVRKGWDNEKLRKIKEAVEKKRFRPGPPMSSCRDSLCYVS